MRVKQNKSYNSYRCRIMKIDDKIFIDRHFLFEITNKCAFNCLYCFRRSKNRSFQDNKIIPKSLVVEICKNMYQKGFDTVTFSGGDPFFYPNFSALIREVVNHCSLDITVFSSCLNRDIIEKIKDNVLLVGVSLDGDEYTHDLLRGRGSYRKTIKTIENLKKYKINFSINSTITKLNFNKIYELVKFSKKHGAKSIRLSHVTPAGMGDKENLLLSFKEIDKLWKLHVILEKKFDITIFTNLCEKNFFLENREVITSLIITLTPEGYILPYISVGKKYSIGKFDKQSIFSVFSSKNKRLLNFSKKLSEIYNNILSMFETKKIEVDWIPWEDLVIYHTQGCKNIPTYINFFIIK